VGQYNCVIIVPNCGTVSLCNYSSELWDSVTVLIIVPNCGAVAQHITVPVMGQRHGIFIVTDEEL